MKCVEMRKAEIDWHTIADALGYASPGHAHNRFMVVMRLYPRDEVEVARDLELDRIEKTCRSLEPIIAAGGRDAVRAAEVWTKLSERRAKMCGYDKPERRELTVMSSDAVEQAIEKLNAEMAAKAAANDVDLKELTAD